MAKREYLGDSVYTEVEEGMMKLYLDNGYGPTNVIYLEFEVFQVLMRVARANNFIEERP